MEIYTASRNVREKRPSPDPDLFGNAEFGKRLAFLSSFKLYQYRKKFFRHRKTKSRHAVKRDGSLRFLEPVALLIVDGHLRCRFARLDLRAHFLQARSKRFNLLLLVRHRCLQVLLLRFC